MIKTLLKIFLIFFIGLILVQCKSNQTKQQLAGEIIYDISYPCLEKNEESLMFLLPKKMIMTFSNNQFKNEFIFPMKNSSLALINNTYKKNAKLIFRLGSNKKYTIIDSNNVDFLLKDLHKYEKTTAISEDVLFLGKPCKKIKIKSLENDSTYEIITLKDLKIKNVNWCTPLSIIKDIIMEYSVEQYGLEMHFKAISIKDINIDDGFLQLEKNYKFSILTKYLKEIKAMLSIFNCDE
tara:strand:- start:9987 stop:10697 length:711 start_codon:yes stop_codon:yes gene_type:complete